MKCMINYDLFTEAIFYRHGAEVVEDHGAQKRGQSFGAFGGSGFKLGDSSQASEVVASGK